MQHWHAAQESHGVCGEKVEMGSHFYQGGKGRVSKDPIDTVYPEED
jgi:hypothetical protein